MNPRFKFNHWLPAMLGADGITLYPWVLFSDPVDEVSCELFCHEMEHVSQVQGLGWFSFYLSYIVYYFAGLIVTRSHHHAYRAIPYEVCAYHEQDKLKYSELFAQVQGRTK